MNSASEPATQGTLTVRPLTAFVYLQILDLMTTIAFLANGVTEGNPFVRFLMRTSATPLAGLVAAKCIAVMLGIFAWKAGRHAALRKANVFFAVLVVWNLLATIAGAAR